MAIIPYRATFTGVELYVDVPIAMTTPFVSSQGITLDDTVAAVDYTITLTAGTNARVEPTNTFTGFVDFVLVDL